MTIQTSDTPLLERARVLARRYRDSVADLVAVIAELDRCKTYERAGYSSLFDFCVKDLELSGDDAYKMIQSARAANARPEVLSFIADGSLTARSAALLAPECKSPDFLELLDKAKGQTVRQVERMVAMRHGREDTPDSCRAVGSRPAGSEADSPTVVYRIAFDADEGLKSLIDRARGLLRHRFPEGRLEDLAREAFSLLLERKDPVTKPSSEARPTARSNSRTRRPPPSVRDEVWKRDGGRCAFVAPDGRRCESTAWLEIDHVLPWAKGGVSDDPSNLRLLCRVHNQSEAQVWFGDGF